MNGDAESVVFSLELIVKSRDLHLWDKYPKGRRVGVQISPGYIASQRPDWPEPVSTNKNHWRRGWWRQYLPQCGECLSSQHLGWKSQEDKELRANYATSELLPQLWLWCGSYCTAQASLKPDMWSSTPSRLQSPLLILPGYSGGRSVPPQPAETLPKGLTSRSLSEKSSLWECPCSGGGSSSHWRWWMRSRFPECLHFRVIWDFTSFI